jgi:hypothetical protein
MRLDSRNGDRDWPVYDAEAMRFLKDVVWVDDMEAMYGKLKEPISVVNGELVLETHRARRIVIYPSRRLVVVNPVEDEADEQIGVEQVAEVLR